jgi:hypothetical protein
LQMRLPESITRMHVLSPGFMLLFNGSYAELHDCRQPRKTMLRFPFSGSGETNPYAWNQLVIQKGNQVCVKTDSGFVFFSLAGDSLAQVERRTVWSDGYYDNHFAWAGNAFVHGNRFGTGIWIERPHSEPVEQQFPAGWEADQLLNVIAVNDSLVLLRFRWNHPLLLNVKGGQMTSLPLMPPNGLSASSGIGMAGHLYADIDANGLYFYDILRGQLERMANGISNIREAYLNGNRLVCVEFYPWRGAGSEYCPALLLEYRLPGMHNRVLDTFPPGLNTDDPRYTKLFDMLHDRSVFTPLNVVNSVIQIPLSMTDDTLFVYIAENLNDYIVINDSGYYMASRPMIRQLRFVKDQRPVALEQIDLICNRPDIIFKALGKATGYPDTFMYDLLANAVERRMEASGLSGVKYPSHSMSFPEVKWVASDTLTSVARERNLRLCFIAEDSEYSLQRFNVLVNEVPLFGSKGIPLLSKHTNRWDSCLNIPLSAGLNRIELHITNAAGLSNFRFPYYIRFEPPPAQILPSRLHFIGVGVDSFYSLDRNLKYCAKDVRDMADAMKLYDSNAIIQLLINQNAVKESFAGLREYLTDRTNVDDRVVVHLSSHGVLNDSLGFYLAMHDMDFSKPERRGMSYEDILSLVDGIPARRKLLMIDACYSGEKANSSMQSAPESGQGAAKTGFSRGGKTRQAASLPKKELPDLTNLFLQGNNQTGSLVIAAATGNQQAFEGLAVNGRLVQNGLFTFSALQYLHKKDKPGEYKSIQRFKQYIEQNVSALTQGNQKPGARQEQLEADWFLFE